jgi:hypothetical protein
MKRLLLILFLSMGLFSFKDAGYILNVFPKNQAAANKVYICNSGNAYVYHSTRNCGGLSGCKHEVLEVSLSEAVNKYKRRACKVCK